jgi:hypothetical protein
MRARQKINNGMISVAAADANRLLCHRLLHQAIQQQEELNTDVFVCWFYRPLGFFVCAAVLICNQREQKYIQGFVDVCECDFIRSFIPKKNVKKNHVEKRKKYGCGLAEITNVISLTMYALPPIVRVSGRGKLIRPEVER